MSKWLWMTLGTFVIGGMVCASLSNTHPEWDAARRWLAERQVVWEADGCPVLGGEGDAGCSRQDYRDAAIAADGLTDNEKERLPVLADSDAFADDALLSATSSAVALLRKGAHRERDLDPDAPRLGEQAVAHMLDAHAAILAFAALRLHARQLGRDNPGDAMDLLLDGLVAAVDLASAGIGIERIVGQTCAQDVIDEFSDSMLRRAAPTRLAQLAVALDRIDTVLPVADDFLEREMAHKVYYFAATPNVPARDVHPAGAWAAWRHGFSMRAYATSTICEQLDLMRQSRRQADPGSSPWPARRAALEWLQAQLAAMPHSYLSMPNTIELEYGSRKTSAALGQLRQAVAFHRGEELPVLRDPLGAGAMVAEVGGEQAVFRSAEKAIERTARRRR